MNRPTVIVHKKEWDRMPAKSERLKRMNVKITKPWLISRIHLEDSEIGAGCLSQLPMKLKIETGIPIPHLGRWSKIVAKMKTGQSFVVDSQSARQSLLRAARRDGFSVTSRKLNGAGWRIWKL